MRDKAPQTRPTPTGARLLWRRLLTPAEADPIRTWMLCALLVATAAVGLVVSLVGDTTGRSVVGAVLVGASVPTLVGAVRPDGWLRRMRARTRRLRVLEGRALAWNAGDVRPTRALLRGQDVLVAGAGAGAGALPGAAAGLAEFTVADGAAVAFVLVGVLAGVIAVLWAQHGTRRSGG